IAVAVLAPALRQHEFVLRFQHREPPDLLKISGKAGFGRQNWQNCSAGHYSALQSLPPVTGGQSTPPVPEPTVLVMLRPRSLIAGAILQDEGVRTKLTRRHVTVTLPCPPKPLRRLELLLKALAPCAPRLWRKHKKSSGSSERNSRFVPC